MKVGIVGSGMAGLTAAWIFGSAGHEVVIYEKHRLGLVKHGVNVNTPGKSVTIDIPSRLMNPVQWPTLLKLHELVGAEVIEVDTTQSFSDQHHTFFNTSLSTAWKVNPLQLVNPNARLIAREASRLHRQGNKDLNAGILDDDVSFAGYLSRGRYSAPFVFGFLYPVLSSTVCTCSFKALDNYPAKILLEVLSRLTGCGDSRLYKTKLGMRDLANRLLKFNPVIKSDVKVLSAEEKFGKVQVEYRKKNCERTGNAKIQFDQVDHLIIATQANHARQLLKCPSSLESEMLSCFQYEDVQIAVHHDRRLVPINKNSWAAFNMITESPNGWTQTDSLWENARSMCSIWMNRLADSSLDCELFQTINPFIMPRRDKLLHECRMQRPVVGPNSFHGWNLVDEINSQPDRRIWFAGSYASRGIPLLESGVVSVASIAKSIGIETPFSEPLYPALD